MPDKEKLLDMLSSSVPQIRLMAMEQLSNLHELPEEFIPALEINSRDSNPAIA
jgi:hypothetical protein